MLKGASDDFMQVRAPYRWQLVVAAAAFAFYSMTFRYDHSFASLTYDSAPDAITGSFNKKLVSKFDVLKIGIPLS